MSEVQKLRVYDGLFVTHFTSQLKPDFTFWTFQKHFVVAIEPQFLENKITLEENLSYLDLTPALKLIIVYFLHK